MVVRRSRAELALAASLYLATALAAPRRAAAQDSATSLGQCLEQVMIKARALGSRPAGRMAPHFLMAPDSVQYTYDFPEDSCVGFLAVGRRQVQDLRLTLFSSTGQVLGVAPETGAYAYARVCGRSGMRVVVHVEVRDGSGEVEVLPVLSAPAVLPGLDAVMTDCVLVGQPRAPAVDVGPEPIGAPLGQRLQMLSAQLEMLGYRPSGEGLQGSLGAMRRELRDVSLPEGACSAIALVPDADVEEVELRILSGSQEGKLLDRSFTVGRPAVVKACAFGAEQFILDIRTYGRGGRYLLQGYDLSPPQPSFHVPGLSSVSRYALWESLYRMAQVGMAPAAVEWVALPARSTFRAPTRLEGDRCYAVAALAIEGIELDDVDLTVSDEHDNLLASDTGPEKTPLVYLCPSESGIFAAHLRAPDIVRPTRALLVIGQPAGKATTPTRP